MLVKETCSWLPPQLEEEIRFTEGGSEELISDQMSIYRCRECACIVQDQQTAVTHQVHMCCL